MKVNQILVKDLYNEINFKKFLIYNTVEIQTIHRLSFFVGYSLYLSLQKYKKKEFLQYNFKPFIFLFLFFFRAPEHWTEWIYCVIVGISLLHHFCGFISF